ncbi:hypothetical protein CTheo_996 [Ceratobasidium theobromae]|uniref:KOW domain-containing protein n=1 Tax=Ceratobasidium theobromae TaxID=1582974 RepID=A0A5N5QUU7_9AGAM|nr:hypothetical protein CTheo_996 [Ceratobasidium theobromae]
MSSGRYLTDSPITRDFRHLVKGPDFRNRTRFPTKLSISPNYPKPSDRIKYWNIVPGDQVRIVRGGHADENKHEVLSVNKTRNFVYLKDVTIQRGHEETSRSSKPIHYSNLQLYVGVFSFPGKNGEPPKDLPVYATRISTSKPVYIPAARRWFWKRYAAGTSPKLPTPPSIAPRKYRHEIRWPTYEKRRPPVIDFPYDTPASVVMKVTWVPSDISKFADFPPYFHIPAPTSQQRISLEQKKLAERARAIQDAYIRGNADPSAPMEQYLARELSNPHSRARKQKRWQEARAESDRLRVKFMRAAKEARQTGGSVTTLGLNLTKKQAAREGLFLFEAHMREAKKARQAERAVQRGAGEKLARKKARKARKAMKRDEALRNLVLEPAANQVLPPSQTATAA